MSHFDLIVAPTIELPLVINGKRRPFAGRTYISQKTADFSCELADLLGFSGMVVRIEISLAKLPVFVESIAPKLPN